MNTEFSKATRRKSLKFILVVGLFGNTTFSFPTIAQIGRPVAEIQAQCNVLVPDYDKIQDTKPITKNGIVSAGKLTTLQKNLQQKANQFGIFPRITVNRPFEILPMQYNEPDIGSKSNTRLVFSKCENWQTRINNRKVR